jgi:transposase
MEPELLTILESLPPKPPRSKLEPHRELIRELRRKGRTYREVARLFNDRLGLHVAPSTLHSFVKVRAKHRKRMQFELPPSDLPAVDLPTALDRVAVLKAKPVVRNAKPARFVFRENEPLTLASSGGKQ